MRSGEEMEEEEVNRSVVAVFIPQQGPLGGHP